MVKRLFLTAVLGHCYLKDTCSASLFTLTRFIDLRSGLVLQGIAFYLTEHRGGILLFCLGLCSTAPSVLNSTFTTESALSKGVNTRGVLIYAHG